MKNNLLYERVLYKKTEWFRREPYPRQYTYEADLIVKRYEIQNRRLAKAGLKAYGFLVEKDRHGLVGRDISEAELKEIMAQAAIWAKTV